MSNNKLRFKDDNGNDYPNWHIDVIENISEFSSGKNLPNNADGKFYNTTMGSVSESGRLLKDKKTNSGNPISKGSLVMPTRDIGAGYVIGKTALIPEDDSYVAGNCTFVIKPFDFIHPLFLSLMINNGKVRKELVKKVAGSAQLMIKISDVTSLSVEIPSLPEQQKIAALFSKLDERIELREQKIASLKEYKKGLQQAVFGNNGERTLRFKDKNGNDYPDWVEVKVGDLSSIKTGKLNANAMVKNGKYKFFTCAREDYLIDTYIFEGEAILIAGNGANLGHIKHYNGKFNAYQRTYVLQDFQNVNGFYLKLVLDAIMPQRVSEEVQDGATPYITLGTVSDAVVGVPCLEEQEKIANLFSKIDNQIELEEQLLKAAKDEKQGLMQRVF